MLKALCHSDRGWEEVEDLSTLSDLRAQAGNLLWAETDVTALSSADVDLMTEEFDLDPLAVEDALNPRQRPKLERYSGHAFAVMHQLDEIENQLEATQIACFIGTSFVLVLHAGADRTLFIAKQRWDALTKEDIEAGPRWLMHTILDVLVDDYQAIADRLEVQIEDIEDLVLDDPEIPVQRDLYSLKQRVARLRRYALPGARVLDWFVNSETAKPYSQTTMSLFRDVHDHLLRINDQIRNIDELADAVLDLRLSDQTSKLNEANKRLSAWAAVIAVPTFIASVYGMNFGLFPDEGSRTGFVFALSLMLFVAVALFTYFRRRKWL